MKRCFGIFFFGFYALTLTLRPIQLCYSDFSDWPAYCCVALKIRDMASG